MIEPDLGFHVTEFSAVLCQEPLPLLVAGQAVNLWATVYARDSELLRRLQPFVSRDCDLYGDAELLFRLAASTGWKRTSSPRGAPTPVLGFLTGQDPQGRTLTVEVLTSLNGLVPKDFDRETVVELDGKKYATLRPAILLKAKLANVIEIPQERPKRTRTDLKHVRILVPCVCGFLKDAHRRTLDGALTERELVKFLEETFKVVTTEYARRVADSHKIDFLACFPPELESSPLAKVRNFVRHRLEPLRPTQSE